MAVRLKILNNNVVKDEEKETQTDYFADGSVWKMTQVQDGKMQGQSVIYYPGGDTQAVMHYLDGNLHGNYTLYYEGGSVWIEGQYENGEEHGVCKIYDKKGRLEAIRKYRNGVLKNKEEEKQSKRTTKRKRN
jgi:antitoxin component YwqK of YwqJK toxin-antitoxin module